MANPDFLTQNPDLSRRDFNKLLFSLVIGGLGTKLLPLFDNKIVEAANTPPYTALNYDESNGDSNPPGQMNLVAKYLREVMAKGKNVKEDDLIKAIQSIQKEAERAGATTLVDQETIDFSKLAPESTWLVWISNRDNVVKSPADIQLPFGLPGVTFPNLKGLVAIVHAFDAKVPNRDISTFACKPGLPSNQRFWAVAIK